jgi:hypothetical protein
MRLDEKTILAEQSIQGSLEGGQFLGSLPLGFTGNVEFTVVSDHPWPC